MINVTSCLWWTKMLNMTKKVMILRKKFKIVKMILMMHHSQPFSDKLPPWRPEEEYGLNFLEIIFCCYAINMDPFHSLQSLQLCKYSCKITNLSFWRYGTYIDWNVVKYDSLWVTIESFVHVFINLMLTVT